jgi:hypothetical protein
MDRLFKDNHAIALSAGVATVALTHSLFVIMPGPLDDLQKKYHSYINLAAAAAIAWGSQLLEKM